MPKGCNASFIALVPKKRNSLGMEDYRHISLVACVYKIISKILANRLKSVLPKIIDYSQSAFIKERGLLDSILVANEVVEEYRAKNKRLAIIKVDYEKAYDSVSWEFLYYMMVRLGFCARWIAWIKECLESSTMSILVNGSPTKELCPKKGLRQGDPMAPFLFLIVVEGLAGMVRQAVKKNLYYGVHVGSKAINVGLLQFADDTLFMCEAKIQNAWVIKSILRSFELASGLRVNFFKTKIGGVGLEVTLLKQFSNILNCKHMKIPFMYLGMPIGGNPRRSQFWQPVINKVRDRLSSWKGKLISVAGRVCLIKSVISALPLYYMSFFKMPKSVEKELIKIQRNFLWGWGSEARKIAWVSWENICKPKEMGGLGIRDIENFNTALLAKWKWRLGVEDHGVWKQILDSKYGSWRVLNEANTSRAASKWWKDIHKVCGNTESGRWFDNCIEWVIGEGKKVKLWEDKWIGEESLCHKFPRLYSISECKGKSLQEVGHWEENEWIWDLTWRRQRLLWETVLEEQFLQILINRSPTKGNPDMWKWKEEGEGIYTVRSAYNRLQGTHDGGENRVFEILWKMRVPPKVQVLGWRLFLDKLPTKTKLLARGTYLQHSLCEFCLECEETIEHLFISCKESQKVWNMCYKWLGLSTVSHIMVRNNFQHFNIVNLNRQQNLVWKGMWLAIIGEIWKQRNGVIFKQYKVDPIEIFGLAQVNA